MHSTKHVLAVHKDHWIRVLRDPNDTRQVKTIFALSFGFADAEKCASYLASSKKEWFVGDSFMTSEELKKRYST